MAKKRKEQFEELVVTAADKTAVAAEVAEATAQFARAKRDLVAVEKSMLVNNESDQRGLTSMINVENALYGEGEGVLEGVVADVYGIRQHCEMDGNGIDLILTISERFLRQTRSAEVHFSFDDLMVQVKSSEVCFNEYWKRNGSSATWKNEGRVALEGEWTYDMILGDFMLQVIGLANGLRDREVGAKMLAMFSPEAVAVLTKNVFTLEQLHGDFYAWLSGVESIDGYGKLSDRLGLGV